MSAPSGSTPPAPALTGYLALAQSFAAGALQEITGNGYARQSVRFTARDAARLSNATGITFGPDVTADWGTIAWAGLFDAPTAGNLLLAWPIQWPGYASVSRTVTLPAGALALSVPRLLQAMADTASTGFPAGSTLGVTDQQAPVITGTGLTAGNGTLALAAAITGALAAGANLADVANVSVARANLNQGDIALPFAASIAASAAAGNVFHVVMTGNAQLASPTGLRPGASYVWRIIQDATGGRTLTFDAGFKFPSGTVPTLTATPGAIDILSAVTDGTSVFACLTKDMR